jgi:hypothetical protein
MVQALARWQHSVAVSEALDALNWMMRPALYRLTAALVWQSKSPAICLLFVVADLLLPITIAK